MVLPEFQELREFLVRVVSAVHLALVVYLDILERAAHPVRAVIPAFPVFQVHRVSAALLVIVV